MSIQSEKCKPLSKDEVHYLLDLVCKYPVITSKSQNAPTNKMKEDAWKCIAEEFNPIDGEVRRPEQLRLKWENLKKNARKRQALSMACNGKLHIYRDDTLERVAAILRASKRIDTQYYDKEPLKSSTPKANVANKVLDSNSGTVIVNVESPLPNITESNGVNVVFVDSDNRSERGDGEIDFVPDHFLFNPSEKPKDRHRKLTEEVLKAKRDKELAIAAYFQAKTQKVQLENEKLRYELEQWKKSREK